MNDRVIKTNNDFDWLWLNLLLVGRHVFYIKVCVGVSMSNVFIYFEMLLVTVFLLLGNFNNVSNTW